MLSKIFGRTAKLYGANVATMTYTNMMNGFNDSVYIRDIPIGFPIKDGTGTIGGEMYLYRGNAFQNSTALVLDAFSSQWQQMPTLFINVNYGGSVPINEAMSLFPNRIELNFGYNVYYISDDDLNWVQLVRADNTASLLSFRKGTTSQYYDRWFVNVVYWGGSTNAPGYYTNRYMWSNLSFITNTSTGAGQSKNSYPYGTSGQNNNWWLYSNQNFVIPERTGFVEGYTPPKIETDPYIKNSDGAISPSGHGGGHGTFSRTGDTIGEHAVPTLSAIDAGFITLFVPTAGEMKSLANYMWSDLFSLDTLKKIFADPMDAILGLSIVPVEVPKAGSTRVTVGNIPTSVSMTKAAAQYVKLSCGSLSVQEYWGAYLDYAPYTKCQIYLPYIGIRELSIDDVMGKEVKVVYYVDILSGACTAEIYSNDTCLYSFVGQCSASIPITGNDWTNVINGVMQIAASIGSMAAGAAAGTPPNIGNIASIGATITSMKPNVERSGSASGAGGMLGQQTPYLIMTWPKECIPSRQNSFIGYPSFVTVNLGDISGFNVVDSIHLENVNATQSEVTEIENILKQGVIF